MAAQAERDLFDASERGDLRALRDVMDPKLWTGLMTIRSLISPGPGATPLHAAAARGHLAIVKALVTDYGADASRTAGFSLEKPVHFAARNGHLACVQFFVSGIHNTVDESTRDWPLLHVAAVAGHEHVVRWLLSRIVTHSHSRGVSDCLHVPYMDHTGCDQLNRILTHNNNVVVKSANPTP
jgi:ankyrin repeat protein